VVNGLSLSQAVLRFEQERRFLPAGGYGGLIPSWFNYDPLTNYFLGNFEPSSYFSAMARIYVLGCECGEVGCWPLVCKVNPMRDKIVWDSFQQPHRPERDYSTFGPFEFCEPQYRGAVADLERELSPQSRSDEI
jgi:hypothetical protein